MKITFVQNDKEKEESDGIRSDDNPGAPGEARTKGSSPRYPRNPCIRFGQSRFGPVKRTALDGRVWWCIYDYRDHTYVTCCRYRKRRQALVQLEIDLRRGRLAYEPDPGSGRDWLKPKSAEELAALVDRRAAF